MKKLIILLTAFVPLICTGQVRFYNENGEKVYHSREECTEDLDYLIKSLEERHPDLYRNADSVLINSYLDSLKKVLPEKIWALDFHREIMKIMPMFNDGHTSYNILEFPFRDLFYFPLVVKIENDRATVVKSDLPDTTKAFAEIDIQTGPKDVEVEKAPTPDPDVKRDENGVPFNEGAAYHQSSRRATSQAGQE